MQWNIIQNMTNDIQFVCYSPLGMEFVICHMLIYYLQCVLHKILSFHLKYWRLCQPMGKFSI